MSKERMGGRKGVSNFYTRIFSGKGGVTVLKDPGAPGDEPGSQGNIIWDCDTGGKIKGGTGEIREGGGKQGETVVKASTSTGR